MMNLLAAPADISSKDLPLREDIRLLGRILGDTLREQEGEAVFNLVENVRRTAVRFRKTHDDRASVRSWRRLSNSAMPTDNCPNLWWVFEGRIGTLGNHTG